MNYKERLDKLLDQGVISEAEHKIGMESDIIEYKDLGYNS